MVFTFALLWTKARSRKTDPLNRNGATRAFSEYLYKGGNRSRSAPSNRPRLNLLKRVECYSHQVVLTRMELSA